MENSKLTVLIVEDDQELIRILRAVLGKLDVELRTAVTVRQALQTLNEVTPAVMLLDMRLPDAPGTDVIAEVKRRGVACGIIVMTAHGSVELAVEAMRDGAYDFMTKPLDFDRLKIMVTHALARHRLIEQLDDYSTTLERVRFRSLRGSSPAMQRLYRGIQFNAAGGAPMLLVGPPGSEFLDAARSVHDEYLRGERRFVTIPSAGVAAENVLETVFGTSKSIGPADEAAGGTLLLEGIHQLPASAQRPLLDYVLTGDRPAGAPPAVEGDPRLIAWAHDDILRSAQTGEFDRDLFHAMSAVMLVLPPLSQRGDDILQLTNEWLQVQSRVQGKLVVRVADDAEEALMRYHWPGNVDELRAIVASGVANCKRGTLRLDDLPPAVRQTIELRQPSGPPPRGVSAMNLVTPLWVIQQEEVNKAIRLCNGNVLEAARLLEVNPGTIYRKQRAWATIENMRGSLSRSS